jgi:hypothetical protein
MFLRRGLTMTNPTKCGVTFTYIYSPKVAKRYEIEAGKLVKDGSRSVWFSDKIKRKLKS